MSRVIAQVTLHRDSGLPADVITNSMHFEDDSGFGTSAGIDTNGPGLMDRIATFYSANGTTLASTLKGTGTVTLYDWSAPKPRVPAMELPFTFTPGSNALPGEVALVLSYRAEKVSGQAQARRRGRIYFGPLSLNAMVQPTGAGAGPDSDPRPGGPYIDVLLQTARTMATGGSGAFRLCVFSPTTKAAGGTDDEAWNDVVALTCDNAFDTVRSRGAAASIRREVVIGSTDAPVNT